MVKLDKRLLTNMSKTTAATGLLSVAPTALACGLSCLTSGRVNVPTAVITVLICMYWLNFKRGRDFKQSFKDGADCFDFFADKIKYKGR